MLNKERHLLHTVGFTLIEVIATFGILVAGLVPLLVAIQLGIRAGTESSNRLIALYLAQEGIELVRNIRDANWASGASWDDEVSGDGDHYADYSLATPLSGKICEYGVDTDCLVGSSFPQPLFFDALTNRYGYSGWALTPGVNVKPSLFTRTINIQSLPHGLGGSSSDYLYINSEVSWQGSGGQYNVTLDAHLYDWRP